MNAQKSEGPCNGAPCKVEAICKGAGWKKPSHDLYITGSSCFPHAPGYGRLNSLNAHKSPQFYPLSYCITAPHGGLRNGLGPPSGHCIMNANESHYYINAVGILRTRPPLARLCVFGITRSTWLPCTYFYRIKPRSRPTARLRLPNLELHHTYLVATDPPRV